MHTILVADDSVTIQRAVEIALDREPFTLVKAASGHEALTRARELKPHLVLADHTMGDQSGYDLAAALRADPATSAIPVVLLSAAANPYDESRGTSAGVVGFVQKPFDCATLLDRVRGVLGVPATAPGTTAAATAPASSAPSTSLSGMPRPPGLGAGLPRPPAPAFPPRPAVAPPATPPVAASAIPRAPTPAPTRDQAGLAAALAQPLTPAPAASSPPSFQAPVTVATATPSGWTAVAPGQSLSSSSSADDAESDFSSLEISTLPPVTSPPAGVAPPRPATPATAPMTPAATTTTAAPRAPAMSASSTPASSTAASSTAASSTAASSTAAAVAAVVAQASTAIASQTGEAPSAAVLSAEARQIVERIAWEVVPELAETIIREELARLLKARKG